MLGIVTVSLIVWIVTAVVAQGDPDNRLYRDSWLTSARFPDKLVHALSGFVVMVVLAAVLQALAGPALITAVAAVHWEIASTPRGERWPRSLTHSWRDVAATWLGVALATAALWWRG